MRRGYRNRVKSHKTTVTTNFQWGKALGVTLLLVVVFIATYVLGKKYVFNKNDQKNGLATPTVTKEPTITSAAVSPTISPTEAPTPTPKPVDLKAYSIQILNGNGKAGATTPMKESLTNAGLNVTSTGNASKWDYGKTEIRVKSGVPQEVIDKVEAEVTKTYVTAVMKDSSDTEGTDILVVLGRELR